MAEASDPAAIEVVVVSAEDLVAALETNRTTGRTAVLRVTPPFSGRMRARLHVEGDETYGDPPHPIHVPPRRFVADDAPAYPRPAETEDRLRADPDVEYTVERHRNTHQRAIDGWRRTLLSAVRAETTLQTRSGAVIVGVSVLGDPG